MSAHRSPARSFPSAKTSPARPSTTGRWSKRVRCSPRSTIPSTQRMWPRPKPRSSGPRPAVQRAEADLGQMKAKLEQAERDWQRAQKLGPSEALAEASYDAYKSAYETAKANLAVGEAAILQAKASQTQAKPLCSGPSAT